MLPLCTSQVIGSSSFAIARPADQSRAFIFERATRLPDHDIAGWEQEKPIGGGEVRRIKISPGHSHAADALFQMKRELTYRRLSLA